MIWFILFVNISLIIPAFKIVDFDFTDRNIPFVKWFFMSPIIPPYVIDLIKKKIHSKSVVLKLVRNLLELNMKNQILNFLIGTKLLSDIQNGFLKERITETTLYSFHRYVNLDSTEKLHACGLFIDCSSAFEYGNQELLLLKSLLTYLLK